MPYAPESWVEIKNGGTAVISQPGQTCEDLSIGDVGSGALEMTGGDLTVTYDTHLGYGACTAAFTQSAGVHTCQNLRIADYGGPTAEYHLSGTAQVSCNFTIVGARGYGFFLQSGPSQHTTMDLTLGGSAGYQGTYHLGGGTLTVQRDEQVGLSGVGVFTHAAGTHAVTRSLWLGANADGNGTYTLQGGLLSAPDAQVARSGRGTFHHTGGTFSADVLRVGNLLGSSGRYNLGGTGGLSANYEYVGGVGGGTFVQDGGTNEIAVDLILGDNSACPTADYQLNEGLLDVGRSVVIGHGFLSPTATFTQTGGAVTAKNFHIADSSNGTYTISGGSLSVENLYLNWNVNNWQSTAIMNITDASAEITVSGIFQLGGGQAILNAVPGATIHMTGTDLRNYCRNPENLAGLNNLALIFEGGAGDTDDFELAGADLGASPVGLIENFALRRLTIGGGDVGSVRFVDDFDNLGDGAGNEVLYALGLRVGPGSSLDLNGHTLYCGWADIAPTATVIGGDVIDGVPEPATAVLFCCGAAGLLLGRRRRAAHA